MRNCLPKIASVFRSKASSKAAAHSNESDAESDTEERYIKVKSTTATATAAAAAITKVESDQLIDNANKKPQQQQQLRPPAKATAADDVDKKRLIRGSSSSDVVKAKDLDLEKQQRQSQSGGQQNSIRKEIKQAGGGGKGTGRGTGEGAGAGTGGSTVEEAVARRGESSSLARPFANNNGGGTSSKTPEQIELEYEASVAAERGDIMTPLPRDPRPQGLAFNETPSGRQMQPEIVEAIRNLDTQALLLNNLTLEDRCRLTQSSSSRVDDDGGGEGTVIMRVKANPFDRQCHSLYERRLHKGPKLHLWVGNGKPRPTPQSNDDDDIKTFQVVKGGKGIGERGAQSVSQ